MLKGKKVNLREIRKSDIDYFLKWFNDPEIMQYNPRYLPMMGAKEEKWIEKIANSEDTAHFVMETRDEKVIGVCGFNQINYKDQDAHIGINIGEKDCWEKGYGTEALELLVEYGFNQLNLHHITTEVYGFNGRSMRVQEKAGFQKEGHQREVVFKNGKYHDRIIFGLLREEWRKNK